LAAIIEAAAVVRYFHQFRSICRNFDFVAHENTGVRIRGGRAIAKPRDPQLHRDGRGWWAGAAHQPISMVCNQFRLVLFGWAGAVLDLRPKFFRLIATSSGV
jgi:hypothetical protein